MANQTLMTDLAQMYWKRKKEYEQEKEAKRANIVQPPAAQREPQDVQGVVEQVSEEVPVAEPVAMQEAA